MLQVLCLMKSRESFTRIKLSVDRVEWEEYISSIESLQERIVLSDYDLAVLDEKLWWKEEAESLLNKRGIEIISFKGNFEETIKLITERIVPEPVEEKVDNTPLPRVKESNQQENNIKYIIKEVPVERLVEKVVVKSRNIKQEIISIISTDDLTMRDSFACNIAAFLTNEPETRTLLVDITNFNNLINHLDIYEYNKYEAFEIENFNANTIQECVCKVKDFKYLHLLSINSKTLTKKDIKAILFAARDYDSIIFVGESNLENLPIKFVLNLSHRLFLVTEPLYLAAKNNLDIIKFIIENGQISENIKVVLTGVDPLSEDDINYMYRGYKVGFLNRSIHLKEINSKKLIQNKKEIRTYMELLDLEKPKKKMFFK